MAEAVIGTDAGNGGKVPAGLRRPDDHPEFGQMAHRTLISMVRCLTSNSRDRYGISIDC